MQKPFFVMMYSQSGEGALPMMDAKTDEVKFFASEEEAVTVAANHPFAKVFGFDVFEMGNGRSE